MERCTSQKGGGRGFVSCSICTAAFAGGSADTPHNSSTRSGNHGQLGASFVNIPHSHYPSCGVATAATTTNTDNKLQQNMHDIESILDEALISGHNNSYENNIQSKEIISGGAMHNASQQMDTFLQAALSILEEEGSSGGAVEGRGGAHHQQNFYCQVCLDRIGQAIESCAERLDEECVQYNKAASMEEERVNLLTNVLCSMNVGDMGGGLGLDDNHDDKEDAIHRAIDSFQYELDTLEAACKDQLNELKMLQHLMQNQMDRSAAISENEKLIHHELNSLEIDAINFGEDSHIVSNNCSAIESEIDAMSHVKLMAIPFDIRIDDKGGGKYPTINNLRLAYRINDKASLHRNEINAAFSTAAQLMAFTLGLYPSFITSTIRIIPTLPCAKILVNLPEGGSVHNLGFDTSATTPTNHVPTKSITLFLVLLSQLCSHIQTNQKVENPPPPYEMKEFTIEDIDLKQLEETDTSAWASIVFCIAANLHWLSEA